MSSLDRVTIDYTAFDVLTFDCYGTLIDWETGIVNALRATFGDSVSDRSDEELLALFSEFEHTAEVPYQRYRAVLAQTVREIADRLRVTVGDAAVRAFGGSVPDWPAFPDSPAALARLQERYQLAVITNCDDDLFAASSRRLGVWFDWIVTAQQARAYKPDLAPFELAFERIHVPRSRILHVAQSLFHDHGPANTLGMTTVWINRRAGRAGGGATPPTAATYDAEFPSLEAFATSALPTS